MPRRFDDYDPVARMNDRSTAHTPVERGAKDGEPEAIPFLDATELEWLRDASAIRRERATG